jgi:CRISPR-associated protein Cmr6
MAFPVHNGLHQEMEQNGGAGQIEHPGLYMDRYASYPATNFTQFDQENGQKPHIQEVIRRTKQWSAGSKVNEGAALLNDWAELTRNLPYGPHKRWEQTTLWRLAAHLSRASTLENASISLHPIYGFAYLPGSGLKGMTKSWATLNEKPKEEIERIFGQKDNAGSVLFLEAWPETWPLLEMDIVNNHHPEYYRTQGGQAPGDWESPIPTYFLAVPEKTVFRFCVARRDLCTREDDVTTAATWLQASLQEMGAGAKTAAGYGYFDTPVLFTK